MSDLNPTTTDHDEWTPENPDFSEPSEALNEFIEAVSLGAADGEPDD
jgi:hypothetical protein